MSYFSYSTVSEYGKYVGPAYRWTETYVGRVACCPLVSHVQYAPRALLRLEKDKTDRWTDALYYTFR